MTTENNTTTANDDNAQTDDLNAQEKKTLRSCEASIANALKAFYRAGSALDIIATGRLYRAEYSTFAKYLRARWDMTPARASQLQFSHRVWTLLKAAGMKTLPTSESQCRPLVALQKLDEQCDAGILNVWQDVLNDGAKVTAALVQSYVNTALGIETKQDAGSEDAQGAQDNAKSASGTSADGPSASAEQRAVIRELKAKVKYLESALAAEKHAHKRTMAQGGLPKSAMAKELYKAGFRTLAKKYHPDHGGSADDFAALDDLKTTLLA